MKKTRSKVARFIASRIEVIGKLQKDIAAKVGFEKPNMIMMISRAEPGCHSIRLVAGISTGNRPLAPSATGQGGVSPRYLESNRPRF